MTQRIECIERALSRLETVMAVRVTLHNFDRQTAVQIQQPLAALIRAVAKPHEVFGAGIAPRQYCCLCDTEHPEHAPDCALLALVDRINGEGK